MTWLSWCRRRKRKEAAERTERKQHEVAAVVRQTTEKTGALYTQLTKLDGVLKRVEHGR